MEGNQGLFLGKTGRVFLFTNKIGMFVTRGLLESSLAIGMRGHLIPRCGDRSSGNLTKGFSIQRWDSHSLLKDQ
jgi:hypothetical protein